MSRNLDDLVISNRVSELVGAHCAGQIHVEGEIELEGLSDFGLVLHHAMVGVQHEPAHEHLVGHRMSLMAPATRKACTVTATSCARMKVAPLSIASTCAAIEPGMR